MWGPTFTHNISLFYPEALLNYFGVHPSNPNYYVLLIRVRIIISEEVFAVAKELNTLIKTEFHKDLLDIEEYSVLSGYWMALEASLSNPLHVGVTWGPKLVQAKFIDTDILGGWKELQEVQHMAYQGTGNLGAWVSLYNKWLDGTDDSIGETLQRRIGIMLTLGIAPFAEAIDSGNRQYPAYPQHDGKHTLESFKPVYRRMMRRAYQRTIGLVQPMVLSVLPQNLIPMSIMADGLQRQGVTWRSRSGNTIFLLEDSLKTISGKVVGSGFVLSSRGAILKKWYGWLPK